MLSRMRAALRPDQQVSPNRGRVVLLNLVLVLAFVVVAVIELTRTYVDARRIASSVDAANTHLVPVQVNTAQVQRLDTTTAVTEQIDKATASLEGKTRKIEQSVTNIQAGAASVQNTVVAINSKVDGITSTARTISTTASALAGTVNDIHNIAASIHDSARGINTSFATLFPVTTMIAYGPPPYGVHMINLNVDRIIVRALDIQADLNNIVLTVTEIDRHAASICRSILVMGPHCGPPVAPGTPAPIYRPAEGAAVGTATR